MRCRCAVCCCVLQMPRVWVAGAAAAPPPAVPRPAEEAAAAEDLRDAKAQRDVYTFEPEVQAEPRVKPYMCADCGRCFTAAIRLRQHAKTHAAAASAPGLALAAAAGHQCGICGRTFSRSNNLRAHMLAHDRNARAVDQRHSACSLCGQTILEGGMRTHLLRVHREVRVECCCGKQLKKKSLKDHRKICEAYKQLR